MKRFILILVLCLGYAAKGYPELKLDSLARELDRVLKNKDEYITIKQGKITDLKGLLRLENISMEQQYDINLRLYQEFEKFVSDSAVFYIQNNVALAEQIGRNDLLIQSKILLASIFSTKGLYIESMKLLDEIRICDLSQRQHAKLYEAYSLFYSHYGQSNGNFDYYYNSSLYRDSMLMLLPHDLLDYKIEYAKKLVYGSPDEMDAAELYVADLLETLTDANPERAVVAFLASEIYKNRGDKKNQERYLMISAIADTKNCIKDNASLQSLALVYYAQGNIKQAYRLIQEAVDDAVFCNVRYRTVEASESYPIINSLYVEKEKRQRKQLLLYLILISALLVVLSVTIVFIYLQVKRLGRIKRELFHSNEALNRLNGDLTKAIANLQEANLVKEEYITHFFDRCSNYIDKLGEYRKSLNKLAANNQLEDLYKLIKSNTIIEEEVEELYKTFDSIFINLYPTFIEDFNALLLPEEQIHPKNGEILNTELRIFALIKLGITDSVKISSFLRYSLRTVYNYRTKVRNKAAVKREEFEGYVALIGHNSLCKS